MSDIRLSKKAIALLAVGVVAVSFLGVLAGAQFLSWRQEHESQDQLGGINSGEASKLRAGQMVPAVSLVALDGTATSPVDLCQTSDALILFLAIDCEPCTEAVQKWSEYTGTLPDGVQVYGLCQDEPEYARAYAEKTAFPFPMYCDTAGVFGSEFELHIFPTVIGVTRGGTIKFIRHGFRREFTPDKAVALLVGS